MKSARSGRSSASTIPDSLVKESSSMKSARSGRSSASTIPDSLVKESSSMKSARSGRSSASTIPDSLVKDSSSQRSSKLSSSSSMMDQCIEETPPSGSNKSNGAGKDSSSHRVPETVTTIPETAMDT